MEINKKSIELKPEVFFKPQTWNDRPKEQGIRPSLSNKIKVHKVLTCKDNVSAEYISKILRDKNERRIFVVDNQGLLKGIITTTDLVYKVLAEDNEKLLAKDIMTSDVLSVDISEDLNKALEIMNKIKSYSCPITDNGKLLGMVSYHDIFSHVVTTIGEK